MSAPLFAQAASGPGMLFLTLLALGVLAFLAPIPLGLRYIPNNRVGIVEKLWSNRGSVPEGRILALNGEAGFQAEVLRGGLHFGYWLWQYRIHRVPLVTVSQGKIGYVYARDGEPLEPGQTLGQVMTACNNFQDARAFLLGENTNDGNPAVGQRGRQRQILREGVYAINLSAFVVIRPPPESPPAMYPSADVGGLVTILRAVVTPPGSARPFAVSYCNASGATGA